MSNKKSFLGFINDDNAGTPYVCLKASKEMLHKTSYLLLGYTHPSLTI